MYKRLILLLAVGVLIVVGTSLAQDIGGTGSVDQEILVESSPPFETGEYSVVEGGGQTTTEVDTDIDGAFGANSSGVGAILVSGEDIQTLVYGNSGEVTNEPIPELESDPIFHLILSEVYYDGTDERIEITNMGDGDFQGNVIVVGAKSTPVSLSDISILSGESKVFGDNLSQVSGSRFVGRTGLAFNFTDTMAINVQLIVSGQNEENFIVDQSLVNQYNDKKTSFEKNNGIVVPVQTGANAQSGYTINPGVYFIPIETGDDVLPPEGSGNNSPFPLSCDSVVERDPIKINEIFPGSEKYPPYVELVINSDITLNSLSISGTSMATGLAFVFNNTGTTLQKNTFLLISSTGFWQHEGMVSVRNRDFSLVSTGNQLVITIGSGQNGQVLDIVYFSGETLGKSIYFKENGYPCARVLDALDDFSPGFERKFLKYFSGTTTTKIECIQTTTGNQSEIQTCPLTGSNNLLSGETEGTSNISGILHQYAIRIIDIDYDPEGSDTNNEKITLLATNISGDLTPLDLSKIFRLKVNGTNKTLPRTLPINTPTTFTKTFGFPNSTKDGQNVVVQLTYGEYVFDTYAYNPNVVIPKKEEVITGDVESTGANLDLSGVQFSITYVLPNPKGKDVIEEIGLLVTGYVSSSGIDMSQGFTLRRGSTKKKLSGFVYENQENILSGNLGLVNKAACILLFYNEQELTKFCYRAPKEGEKIFASDQGLEETSQENLDILNLLQLKKINNKLCIWYKDQSFLCKNIPAGKAAIKTTQEQKLYKGLTMFVKQYIIDNRKGLYYDTPLKLYFDQLTQSKKLIAKGIAHIDIYGQTILVTDLKQQVKVLQTTLPGIIALFEGENVLH